MMGGGGGLLGTFTKGLSQFLEGILVLGSASVASVQGLTPEALGAGVNRNQVQKRAHDLMEAHTRLGAGTGLLSPLSSDS